MSREIEVEYKNADIPETAQNSLMYNNSTKALVWSPQFTSSESRLCAVTDVWI